MRAILVALSMPSAGLGEAELDAGLGVGVALDVSLCLLELLRCCCQGQASEGKQRRVTRWCHIGEF